jgi:putative DNA methylase
MLDTSLTSTSPQIAPHPKGRETRLIDNGLLHYEASLAGFAERYGRGETAHTIHVWWARRPHSAMRALVFASLCKDSSDTAIEILKSLPSGASKDIEKARLMLSSQYEQPPRLLDMFGGGGTIPIESSNIGAETFSVDANELSIFIQRCNLIYSQAIDEKDREGLLRASGERIISQLAQESSTLFPLRKQSLVGNDPSSVYGYLWTYSMLCPSCGYKFYLMKRSWLSKKNGRNLALTIENEAQSQKIQISKRPDIVNQDVAWCGRNGTVQCPKCGNRRSQFGVKDCADELVALVRPAEKTGKDFITATPDALPSNTLIEQVESAALHSLGSDLPSSILPRWSGIVNPAIYGIETHADFLNRRQRAVLVLLIKALRDEYERLRKEHNESISLYVIGILSSLIDQLVDWNCRLSMWIPQNEQVGRAFCGPGVPMLWDYIETDPVLNGPANLQSKLNRIISGAVSIKHYPHSAQVQKGYAQALPFSDGFFDAIVTDPPYYDNIYYNVLADFFYAWKRLLLRSIEPDLFGSPSTDNSRELVASKFRSKTADKAHEDYCGQLTLALCEAARVLKPDGVFSFVYSHSSLRGWEAIIRAYRATSFRVTSVQPLSIERKQRPRAMTSEAVNTCITFVAHKGAAKKKPVSINNLKTDLKRCADELAPQLLAVNWNEQDTALAVFANGVAMLSNAEKVTGVADDIEALRALESIVKETIPSFSVNNRKSL